MYDSTFTIIQTAAGPQTFKIDLHRPRDNHPLEAEVLGIGNTGFVMDGALDGVAAAEVGPNAELAVGTVLAAISQTDTIRFRIPNDSELLTVYTPVPAAGAIHLRVRECAY